MFKFTIPPGHKAGACAEDGVHRYAIHAAIVAKTGDKRALVISTDCKTISVLPVETDGDVNTVLIPPKACEAGKRPLSVEVDGRVLTSDGKKTSVHELPPQEGRLPCCRDVFPKSVSKYREIGLDIKLLSKLARAISPDGRVTLLIPTKGNGPIGVVGTSDDVPDGIGLIMPLDQPDRSEYFTKLAAEIPDKLQIGQPS